MKILPSRLCWLGLAALPLLVNAAPLERAMPVHAQPAADAPVLTELPAGSELPPPAPSASAPRGWIALQLPGPHEVYVENKDITKSLDVRAGAAYRSTPSTSAPAVATAEADDAIEIIGLRGRWTQLRIDKPIVGFAQSAQAGNQPAAASTAAPAARPAAEQKTPAARPAPAQASAPRPGQAAPSQGDVAGLPRLFEGRFVSTRSPLRPRRPFDYALVDQNGARIAYVDLSKLLLTDQIENYVDRTVAAYGVARPLPDSRDIVVTVESLQLR